MATFEKPKPSESVPLDLLPVIRASGVLNDRLFAEIKIKVLNGDYPNESRALADRLVREKIITEYQAKRFLSNKSHGLVVGRYAILDRLGTGSMGRVYKAHHVMMDRIVALKIIAPEIATNERVVARFQREMKLVGRLDHPNVVRAFDADQVSKVLYIVMEYVPGQSLGQKFRQALIPPVEMVNYAAQAALGLAHAHEQGIVHRDIKPSNLLLTGDQKIKVLDLGLGVLMEADDQSSFATADGIAVGTVDYMSPEQACGRDVDGRSDLFSLGCAMYHMMTGKLPFPGDNPIERLGKRISGRPAPITEVMPDVPATLVPVLEKLMAHKPADRYQTAGEAAEALQALLRPRTKKAAPRPAPAPPSPVPAPALASASASPLPSPGPGPMPLLVSTAPEYPAWFLPLANLAEQKPRSALVAVLGALAAAFGVGFGLARLLH
jgi:serine/threonine-protein kinase